MENFPPSTGNSGDKSEDSHETTSYRDGWEWITRVNPQRQRETIFSSPFTLLLFSAATKFLAKASICEELTRNDSLLIRGSLTHVRAKYPSNLITDNQLVNQLSDSNTLLSLGPVMESSFGNSSGEKSLDRNLGKLSLFLAKNRFNRWSHFELYAAPETIPWRHLIREILSHYGTKLHTQPPKRLTTKQEHKLIILL